MPRLYLPKLLLFFLLALSATLSASVQYAIISLEAIIIPIPIGPQTPAVTIVDTTPPSKPSVTTTLPNSTYEEEVQVEISGESWSSVYINNQKVATIDDTGKCTLTLATSGDEGVKTFYIVLKDNANNTSQVLSLSLTKMVDPKYSIGYKGLTFYHKNLTIDDYALKSLSDEKFNTLSSSQKLTVANTLLSTLFFGYPQDILLQKINSGTFMHKGSTERSTTVRRLILHM
jgi:hypothetical protein